MFRTLSRILSTVFTHFTQLTIATDDIDDVTHLLEADTVEIEPVVSEKPTFHTAPSTFFRWVDELDDEVTEYIPRRRVSQLILRAERRSDAIRSRKHLQRGPNFVMLDFAARA